MCGETVSFGHLQEHGKYYVCEFCKNHYIACEHCGQLRSGGIVCECFAKELEGTN
jgi:hypothetical protein